MSPEYEDCEMKIQAKFGSLMINYKCETVIAILEFIKVPAPPSIEESLNKQKTLGSDLNKSLNES